jgi:leader peptidase (prepilin peptidase)/N-methyltransferase
MNMSERSHDRLIHRRYYSRLTAGEASQMTAPARVAPTRIRSTATVTRAASDVHQAWTAAPGTVRTLTLGAAIAALTSSMSVDVPLASALAIAVMAPAALVDWHQRRLPDALVLGAATVFAVAWLTATLSGANISLASIGLGVAVFTGPLLVLHLTSPQAMGFGDVKSAAVLGMAIGAVGWGLAAWALTAAAAATALAGIARRRSTLPFGPGLVAGALSAVLAAAFLSLDGIGF